MYVYMYIYTFNYTINAVNYMLSQLGSVSFQLHYEWLRMGTAQRSLVALAT